MIDSVYVLSRAISVIAVVIGILLLAPLMRTSWLISGVMIGLFALEASLWIMAVNDVYGGRADD
ncbi:hypothetical protein [Actinomyces sp.]|uniref:hypothetical protein n=1 Tax=Actinomyces sp. TaxID=29317 RepID=UPI00290DB584|nr:hypothetical protein [Actinomyces sp.]MDU6757752.1 hypothetical protein [Actinomyces sp.]